MGIRPARLGLLALSASGHERMVNGRAAASGEKWIDLSVGIARFDAILKEGAARRDRAPFVLCQSGGRWQAVASGGGSAHDLTPLVWRGAWGVRRENSGQGDGGDHPRFPGAKKWVAHSALSDDL